MTAEIISSLLMLVGGITILTNIIVQVVKSITWDKIPTNLVALFVSEALTLALGGAYASVKGIDIAWYMVAAAIVVGLMSAYAAMFGFDKFKETEKLILKEVAERDPFQTYGGFLKADPVYGTGKGGRPSRRSEQVWPGGGGGPLVRNPC